MAPATRRLPGVQPLDRTDWLVIDEAFTAQMALRDQLLSDRRAEVYAEGAEAASRELLALILRHLGPEYDRTASGVTRPDGVTVPLSDPPLLVAGRLVQEDLCLLQKPEGGAEHVLSAAVLCFPASWTLAEKIGRPLTRIHRPVAPYDESMATRVQRLFDLMHPDRPMWRQNALFYEDPALYQPAPEAAPRETPTCRPRFVRSERQCLLKLPETGAIVFSIHTWVLPFARLTAAQRAGLESHPIETADRS